MVVCEKLRHEKKTPPSFIYPILEIDAVKNMKRPQRALLPREGKWVTAQRRLLQGTENMRFDQMPNQFVAS